MKDMKKTTFAWRLRVAVLSLLLIFVAIPHTLEDFALGEPAKNGVPFTALATVVAVLFTLQGLGLYWLGQNDRRAYFIHAGLGLFWPLAAGGAQLPTILTLQPYRSGLVSLLYVAGMLILGAMLFLSAVLALRAMPSHKTE